MNSKLIAAVAFAAHKHRDQRRKDRQASPYINHPIALANVLANEAAVDDPIVLCAALLHDTIEDTQTTAEELRELFGEAVTATVLEVTDDKMLPKSERKRLQIAHAALISERGKLVKLADKICNVRDMISSPPIGWSDQRRREYLDWSKSVVDQLRSVDAGLAELFDAEYTRGIAGIPCRS